MQRQNYMLCAWGYSGVWGGRDIRPACRRPRNRVVLQDRRVSRIKFSQPRVQLTGASRSVAENVVRSEGAAAAAHFL